MKPLSDTDSLMTTLDTDEWFSSCALELKQGLLRSARLQRLGPGEVLYRDGQLAQQALFCVVEGAVRICSSLQNGTTSLLAYLEPCHWFGDISLIDSGPYVHDAVADVESRILCVPLQPFTQWLDQNPQYWRDIARLSINKLRVAYQVIAEPGALQHRLARRLWLLAHGFGSRAQRPSPHLSVSQEDLAQMMGSTRQSINAALARLEGLGLLKQGYKSIEISDLARLLDHANHLESGNPAGRI